MLKNMFFYWLGLSILFLNKARYAVTGYHRPRAFSVSETKKAVKYDHEVVERWERQLVEKGFGTEPFAGKRILELGPGADLGVGLILVAKGAESYIAFDKNPLADRAPRDLHTAVIKSINDAGARARASESLSAYEKGQPTTLSFKQDSAFSFKWLAGGSVDLVVSNAAFEHFDHVPQVLAEVSRVLAPGGVLVAQVDLQTHTRVIRERDPLNIYRYSSILWRLGKFSGIPNRVRPNVYESTLKKLGFSSIDIVSEITLSEKRVASVRSHLNRAFRKDPTLPILSFIVVAKK